METVLVWLFIICIVLFFGSKAYVAILETWYDLKSINDDTHDYDEPEPIEPSTSPFAKTLVDYKISNLLKTATEHKKAEQWGQAIDCLIDAYILMDESNLVYTLQQWLRLPLYLQQAGRYREAMDRFDWLLLNAKPMLEKEFPRMSDEKLDCAVASRKSTIMDKMRLAAQREHEFATAAYYLILSKACKAVFEQMREWDTEQYQEFDFWNKLLSKPLEKAGYAEHQGALTEHCLAFGQHCTEEAYIELANELEAYFDDSTAFAWSPTN